MPKPKRDMYAPVKEILERNPETRSSDNKLIGRFLIEECGISFRIGNLIGNLDFPLESIPRIRRFVQRDHPRLKNKFIAGKRAELAAQCRKTLGGTVRNGELFV